MLRIGENQNDLLRQHMKYNIPNHLEMKKYHLNAPRFMLKICNFRTVYLPLLKTLDFSVAAV